MSQPSLGARLDQLLATLGELPPVDEITTLSGQVEALKLSLAADEPPSPQQPTTLKDEDWDSYEAECLARARLQRQRRLEEAKLQLREKQIGRLFRLWTEFLQVAAPQEPPADAYAEMDDQVRRVKQKEHSDGSGGDAEEAGDEQGRSTASEAPLPSETSHTSEKERLEVLTFEDVWNGGNPRDMILSSNFGKYYVVRCRRGQCSSTPKHFGTNPCQGARTHLRKVHREEMDDGFEYNDSNTLQLLGIGVEGCTEVRARQNNAAFKTWYKSKRQKSRRSHQASPPPSQPPVVKQVGPNKRPPPSDVEEQPLASALRRAKRLKKAENIEAGQVYCHEIPGAKCRAAIIVPLFDKWSPERADVLRTATDLGFFTREANANNPVPRCIDYDEEKELAKGWVSEYNGANRHKRIYPALFIKGAHFPGDTEPGWVSAEDLGVYDEFSVDQHQKEHLGVRDYLGQMEEAEARAERRDEQRNSAHITDQLSHPEQSIAAQSDAAHDQSNTDTQEAPTELAPHAPAEVPPEPSDAARREKETSQQKEMPGQSDATEAEKQSEKAHQETQEAYRASLGLSPGQQSQPEQWISTSQGAFVPPNSTREGSYSISEPSAAGELPFIPTQVSRPHRPTASAEPPLRRVALPSDGQFSPWAIDRRGSPDEASAVLDDLNAASRRRLLGSQGSGYAPSSSLGSYCRDVPGGSANLSIQPLTENETCPRTRQPASSPRAPIAGMGETSGEETVTMPEAGPWSSMNGHLPATSIQPFTKSPTHDDSNPSFKLPGPVDSAYSSGATRSILCSSVPTDSETYGRWSG